VDQSAGLPQGSTSYYFRTRQALLQATVEWLGELSIADLTGFRALTQSRPTDIEQVATAIARVLSGWLTVDRDRVIARYELSLEATRRPELRAALITSGAALRAAAADLLATIGARDPKTAAGPLVACLDGLLFDQIAGAGEPLSEEALRHAVADLLQQTRNPRRPDKTD